MSVDITFSKAPSKSADTAVIFVFENKKTGTEAKALDRKAGGLISRALKAQKNFKGKKGESLSLTLPEKTGFSRAVCIGLGKPGKLDARTAEETGGKLFRALEKTGAEKAAVLSDSFDRFKEGKLVEYLAHMAMGLKLRSYTFDHYKTKKAKKDKTALSQIAFITKDPSKPRKIFDALSKISEGVFFARDLVNEPPNHIHPESFAKRLKKELSPLGVKVSILDEKKMKKLGMGAALAVGQGSIWPPRVAILEWNGGGSGEKKPVALVGKGITFDTGGISIKPANNMHEMKMDMGGAAAVSGTMKALALRQSKAHVVAILGLAENMPGHNAYRPGDIVKSYSGKTIEILNTDAEGRLVLADMLSYVQDKYAPHTIIDLATLTGAMMVALGFEYCGTFVNDNALWRQMEKASAETGEQLWRMPLDEYWKKQMESETADLQNLGKSGRWAGACTAAGFLEHFIKNKTPWAHMDIAGMAWRKYNKPTVPKYGTGFGVRVLDRLIADYYED